MTVDPAVLVAAAAAAVAYRRGVRLVDERGRTWPAARSAAFAAGLVALAAGAVVPDEPFGAHAVQHLLMGMVAPPLLALGAPVTLALQAAGRANRARLRRVLRSRVVAMATHPLVAGAAFAAAPVALYFTGLYDATLRDPLVHELVHAGVVAGGLAFFWPLVGLDSTPHRLHHAARLGWLLLAVPFHGFLGVALLSGADADRRLGGGIIWASGDVLALVAVGVVVVQWMAAEERAA